MTWIRDKILSAAFSDSSAWQVAAITLRPNGFLKVMSFFQFVAACQERDHQKIVSPTKPKKWTPNPFLKSQKILPLDRTVHDGTQKLAKACSGKNGETALAISILYRCSGSCDNLLALAKHNRSDWGDLLAKWSGPVINSKAYRPTNWPKGHNMGRDFFVKGHIIKLIDHSIGVANEWKINRTRGTMLTLSTKFGRYFAKTKYNQMGFALQEVIKDITSGILGATYQGLVDPDSSVYIGPGCKDGLAHSHALGTTNDAKVKYLSMRTRAMPRLSWVTTSDAEHHLCEYGKYVDIVKSERRKPHKPHRFVGARKGAGFLDSSGHLKSAKAMTLISLRQSRRAAGHIGKNVAPHTVEAQKKKLRGLKRGGQMSGYANKSPEEVERLRKIRRKAALRSWESRG